VVTGLLVTEFVLIRVIAVHLGVGVAYPIFIVIQLSQKGHAVMELLITGFALIRLIAVHLGAGAELPHNTVTLLYL